MFTSRSLQVVRDQIKPMHRHTGFIGFSLILLLLMANPIADLVALALDFDNKAASQIVVIPFISGALIYLKNKTIFREVGYSYLSGTILLLLGVGLFISSKTLGARIGPSDGLSLSISSLIVFWLGGFLFFYGRTAFRSALFPLLFLLFCIPIPSPVLDRIIAFLQFKSADAAYALLKLTGTPIHREGIIFVLPDLVILVEPECSGIRSGISLFISSFVAGYVLLQSFWRRATLLVAVVPIMIFKNALRIGTLALLGLHVDRRILTGALHQEGGIPFFIFGLMLLTPVLAMLVKSEKRQPNRPSTLMAQNPN